MTNAAEHYTSFAEYLAIEQNGDIRYEWEAGTVHAMTGGSKTHNRLSFRLARQLSEVAETQGCDVYIGDVKAVTDLVAYYPDVMVVCDPTDDPYLEEHPCLIAEVLSPSTERRDRHIKWAAYSKIPSLKHYLLISQTEPVIEHRYRTDLGWMIEVLSTGESLTLRCPNTTVSIDSLYQNLSPTAA